MLEILSRLSVKSLARFRCVCKLWLKYINDHYFHAIHIKEEPTPMMLEQLPFVEVFRFDITKQCKINFLQGVQKEPVFDFYYNHARDCQKLVLGSCNGLTLVCYEKYRSRCPFLFAVVNPLSRKRHDLPPLDIDIRHGFMDWGYASEAVGIGFDESTNTLKTVFVFTNVVRLHPCAMVHYQGMSSWRKIAQFPAYPISGEGVYGHGCLHWLTRPSDWLDRGKLVLFDMKTEEFGLTGHPPTPRSGSGYEIQLVDLNNEVGFAYVGIERTELWILKQEDSSWVLHCWFDHQNITPPLTNVPFSGYWNKARDIAFTSDEGKRLFVYTLKTGVLLQIDHPGDHMCESTHIRMYHSRIHDINTSIKLS
ncbi:F-box/kelch-repeat protein At3g23880-like [Bidens hawaiensis]|uniref:F-box/kelch-repeat protein At3g23880-like n=1 Tax=Bidens hawaiensis TaxID=980011 RepID=UPI00404B8856